MNLGRCLSKLIVICLFAASAFAVNGAVPSAAPNAPAPASRTQLRLPSAAEAAEATKLLNDAPLLFERNEGQYGDGFDFVSRTPGRTFLLHPWGALVNLRNAEGTQQNAQLALRFVGSHADARPVARPAVGGTINYYSGNDRTKWRTGIASYARLRYSGVYEGIDVEYYGQGDQLEYDLIVAPGADPKQIGMSFDGSRAVCIDADGALVVETAAGELRQVLPHIYQRTDDGNFTTVAGSFTLDHDKVGIRLGAYDAKRELIIDPTILWSHQFLSGELAVTSVAADASGNVFIAGQMYDPNTAGGYDILPVNGSLPVDANPGFTASAFIMGIGPAKNVLFATYLGGSGNENPISIAVAAGSIFVLGATDSDDFPTTGAAYQPLHVSSSASPFVAKLTTSGSLLWATYVSGEGDDSPAGLAVDSAGSAYITGTSNSHTFPATRIDGGGGAYVTKLTPDGTGIVYSTVLGGPGSTSTAIALDETNTAYIAGYPGLPVRSTPGAMPCPVGMTTFYVAKLTPTGAVGMLTCMGATGTTSTLAIAVDAAHDIYLAGQTYATDFPVTGNAYQSTGSAFSAGFYLRLDSSGSFIRYATYLGASTDSSLRTKAFSVVVDGNNQAVVAASGVALPQLQGFPYSVVPISRIMRFTAADALEFSTPIGGTLGAVSTDSSSNIFAVTINPLVGLNRKRSYVIVRKITGNGSQDFSLLNVDQPARLLTQSTTLTANAEFGYFLNGVQLSIGGVGATFQGLSGGAQPSQSYWGPPTVTAGVHAVTVVNGSNSATIDNGFEYVDEPIVINTVTPSTIDSTATTRTQVTLNGTGFPPELQISIIVPGSNPAQSYALEAYRVDKHNVVAVIPSHPSYSNAWTGTYDIQVANAGGGVLYTKPAALAITGTTVSRINGVGPTTGGTPVGFRQYQRTNSVSAATFDSFAAGFASVTAADYNSVTLTSPAHSLAGRVSIVLQAPSGAYALPNAFRYYQAITISNVTPTTGPPSGGTPITITGTGFVAGARVFVGGLIAAVTNVTSTSISATTPAHAPGTVKVAVRNADGGFFETPGAVFTYTGPVVTSVSPSLGPSTGGTSVTVNVTGHDGTAGVFFGTTPATVTNRAAGSITVTTPAHAAGIVDVVVTNSTGDSGTLNYGFRFTSIPQVVSFNPTSGGPGTSVVITGSLFTGTTRVTFGGVVASFVENSSTQLTATVPAGALTGPIAVTVGLDTGTSAGTFGVPPRFGANPFSPTSGVPGTSVTINGANFQGTTQVTFNGTTATPFTVAPSGSSITTTVPVGATTGTISVVTPLGTITTGTSFVVPPVITSFTPPSAGPGATVTITGARFTGATAVAFGGYPASSFSVVNDTSITAVVGTSGGTGYVTVTTPSGTATSSSAFTFTGPTISGFTPNKYSTNPQTVTITGTNLSGATAVSFGGVPLLPGTFVVDSATQITATLTANPSNGPIAITVGTATATSADYFYGIPQIDSFSPTSGAPGDIITITGRNFLGTNDPAAVGFGGTSFAASPVYTVNSNTSISAMVPGFAATGTISVLTPYGFRTYSAASFTVTAAPPPTLTARGVAGSKAIALTWTGAIQPYDIQRGPSAAGPWTTIAASAQTVNAIDNTTTSGIAYFYRVLRVGTPQISNADFAVSFLFTDDPLAAGTTVVRAVHLTELRTAVNLMRVAAGLTNYSWGESVNTGTTIKASHINELRTAVTQAWNAIGVPQVNFTTDPGTITNTMPVKALHFGELRNAVK